MIKPEDDKVGRTLTAGGNGETLGEGCSVLWSVLLFFASQFFFFKGKKLKDLDFNEATKR